MKNLFILLTLVTMLSACSSANNNSEQSVDSTLVDTTAVTVDSMVMDSVTVDTTAVDTTK